MIAVLLKKNFFIFTIIILIVFLSLVIYNLAHQLSDEITHINKLEYQKESASNSAALTPSMIESATIKNNNCASFSSSYRIIYNDEFNVNKCRIDSCYEHITIINDTITIYPSRFCENHHVRCTYPNCDRISVTSYGLHNKYCDRHKNTCEIKNCEKRAIWDNYTLNGVKLNSKRCEKHTIKCIMPHCSKKVTHNYYSGTLDKFCEQHFYTCKIEGCFKQVPKKQIKSSTNYYCQSHTPVCKNPSCNERVMMLYGVGFQTFCDQHINTCVIRNCYKEVMPIVGLKPKYCSEHFPKCKQFGCEENVLVGYSGSLGRLCEHHDAIAREIKIAQNTH